VLRKFVGASPGQKAWVATDPVVQEQRNVNIDAYCTLGLDREYDLLADDLLHALDGAGVERALIAPVDRCIAVANRAGNDFLLTQANNHRRRLIPSCSVNPWFGKEAVEEMQRCLGQGARVLVLHPAVQGYQANDELVWPLLDVAAHEKAPVYVHTGLPGNSTPWQLVDLAERYPEVDFLMGHCGATDFWNDVIGVVQATRNVYLESSCARPFNFERYMRALGKERGIMGSFTPLNELDIEWEQMRRFLPPQEWGDVYGDNFARILGKRGSL
jgi:predicted TIM-barrel fold metal-dependent hydrolase